MSATDRSYTDGLSWVRVRHPAQAGPSIEGRKAVSQHCTQGDAQGSVQMKTCWLSCYPTSQDCPAIRSAHIPATRYPCTDSDRTARVSIRSRSTSFKFPCFPGSLSWLLSHIAQNAQLGPRHFLSCGLRMLKSNLSESVLSAQKTRSPRSPPRRPSSERPTSPPTVARAGEDPKEVGGIRRTFVVDTFCQLVSVK